MFRNVTLKCLTEIAAVTVPNYEKMFVKLFTHSMSQLETMLPVDTNIKEAYANGIDVEQQFIQESSTKEFKSMCLFIESVHVHFDKILLRVIF